MEAFDLGPVLAVPCLLWEGSFEERNGGVPDDGWDEAVEEVWEFLTDLLESALKIGWGHGVFN